MIQSVCKPERVYIGSAKDIAHRWRCHLYELRKDEHRNTILQNHYNKYGESDLKMSIVKWVQEGELLEAEQSIIDAIDPHFNICRKANRPVEFQYVCSEETKEKLRKANIGKKLTEEHKAKLSAAKKGRTMSEEQKAKISEALKGRKKPLTYSQKLSQRNKERGTIPPSRKGIKRKIDNNLIINWL